MQDRSACTPSSPPTRGAADSRCLRLSAEASTTIAAARESRPLARRPAPLAARPDVRLQPYDRARTISHRQRSRKDRTTHELRRIPPSISSCCSDASSAKRRASRRSRPPRNGAAARSCCGPARRASRRRAWPIETFFHKIVMLRNRLRTLEQQVNAADLPEDVKAEAAGLRQRMLRIADELQRALRRRGRSVQRRWRRLRAGPSTNFQSYRGDATTRQILNMRPEDQEIEKQSRKSPESGMTAGPVTSISSRRTFAMDSCGAISRGRPRWTARGL